MTSSSSSSKKKKKNSSSSIKEVIAVVASTNKDNVYNNNNITRGVPARRDDIVVAVVEEEDEEGEQKFLTLITSSSDTSSQTRKTSSSSLTTKKNTNGSLLFFLFLILGLVLPIIYNFVFASLIHNVHHNDDDDDEARMMMMIMASNHHHHHHHHHHPYDQGFFYTPPADHGNNMIPDHYHSASFSSSLLDPHRPNRDYNNYNIHPTTMTYPLRSSLSIDPYLIHMTRSVPDYHQTTLASSMTSSSSSSSSLSSSHAKSRINSSTSYHSSSSSGNGGPNIRSSSRSGSSSSKSGSRSSSMSVGIGNEHGVTYPSYKYYYYDVYSDSFRLYPQPWDHINTVDIQKDMSTTSTTTSSHSKQQQEQQNFPPTLCHDGYTLGYSDWMTLRNAIHERNYEYEKHYSRWNWFENAWSEYEMIQFLHSPSTSPTSSSATTEIKSSTTTTTMTSFNKKNQYPSSTVSSSTTTTATTTNAAWKSMDSSSSLSSSKASQQQQQHNHHRPWIEPPHRPPDSIMHPTTSLISWKPFILCPDALIQTPRKLNIKYTSIFINTESLELKCGSTDGCIWNGVGSHLTFGPQAKNIWISGITFTGATTSSLRFPYHRSEVNFLRCNWLHNRGYGTHGGGGAIMDVVSTSTVIHMYGCDLSEMPEGSPPSNNPFSLRSQVNTL